MKTIWIDITDLLDWSGHFTGTQKVTAEIAIRFQEKSKNTRFFAYSPRKNNFFAIDSDLIFEYLRKSDSIKATSSLKSRRSPRSIKGVLKAQSINLYRNIPFSVKQRITEKNKKDLKNIVSLTAALRNKFLKKEPKFIRGALKFGPIRFNTNDVVLILGKPWDNINFIYRLREIKGDINFSVYHLIYDMIPSFLPHLFGKPLPHKYTEYMFEALSLSDKVFAISKSTETDIYRFCKELIIDEPTVSVIRLGDEKTTDVSKKPYGLSIDSKNNYILCVGTLEIRKNHILLYMAYRASIERNIELPDLIIVGGKGWFSSDVLYEIHNDPLIKGKIKILNGISDGELKWLYQNCKYTVYPSIYEGWGLPIAESLSYGKVCLASYTSSMQEIGGNLINYFSPYNPSELVDLMNKYSQKDFLQKNEMQILKRFNQTKWDDTFLQIFKEFDN